MKNLKNKIDQRLRGLELYWTAIPRRKQHRYTIFLFAGYLVLTLGIILKISYDTEKSNDGLIINHIENPVIKRDVNKKILRDSLSALFKNKLYEQ